MIILGIETSCDETSAALVENGKFILSNIVASSSQLHTQTGGIIPERAAREQVKYIIPVLQQALSRVFKNPSIKNNNTSLSDLFSKIDAIAVTVGPGLIGSLLVGVETARTLAYVFDKPTIAVNHLVAHIYANFLEKEYNDPQFPAIALVVSGGHSDLVLIDNNKKIKSLGSTRDDAAGEAFDKCARLLGLPYPGGPSISSSAEKYLGKNLNSKLNLFPRPMINENGYDFSFSGLKTSVLYYLKDHKTNPSDIPFLAANIQEAIVDLLVTKSLRAVKQIKPRSFLLAGGVSANLRLRDKIKTSLSSLDLDLFIPKPIFCTDNAAAIASCGFFNSKTTNTSKLIVNPQLSILD